MAVMRLEDLGVPVFGIERCRRLFDQSDQHVQPQRKAAGAHDGDGLRCLGDVGQFRRIETGRADDQGWPAAGGARPWQVSRGRRRGEVDDHIGRGKRLLAADQPIADSAGPVEASGERQPWIGPHGVGHLAAHAAERAGDGDPDRRLRHGLGYFHMPRMRAPMSTRTSGRGALPCAACALGHDICSNAARIEAGMKRVREA